MVPQRLQCDSQSFSIRTCRKLKVGLPEVRPLSFVMPVCTYSFSRGLGLRASRTAQKCLALVVTRPGGSLKNEQSILRCVSLAPRSRNHESGSAGAFFMATNVYLSSGGASEGSTATIPPWLKVEMKCCRCIGIEVQHQASTGKFRMCFTLWHIARQYVYTTSRSFLKACRLTSKAQSCRLHKAKQSCWTSTSWRRKEVKMFMSNLKVDLLRYCT